MKKSLSHPPTVTVGIVSAQRIDFCLNGTYQVNGMPISGPQTVELSGTTILWQGRQYHELLFSDESLVLGDVTQHSTLNTQQTFTLNDVTIGNGFHWERQQQQTFLGALRFIVDKGRIWAINELPVEDYLESVIASEMSATSSLEFLKAHAVISRSWLLYQKQKRGECEEVRGERIPQQQNNSLTSHLSPLTSHLSPLTSYIRWYDREDHDLFDVCADDHCQRYQGVAHLAPSNLPQLGEASAAESSAASSPQLGGLRGATSPSWGRLEGARGASSVRATRGQVLTYDGELCDTRFSKCCGGRTEEFQYCWEDTPKPYLQSVPCHWCDTKDAGILRQVLNDYDQETADFHDWTVEYTADELSALVNDKLQADLGTITDLIPLSRGKSGRIWRLQIVGTKGSVIIGKELEIRRALSPTHLYSSNFEVEKLHLSPLTSHLSPLKFTLHGHGWGHGVGLCQIGAAVMAHEGHSYQDILLHYYPGAEITSIYG